MWRVVTVFYLLVVAALSAGQCPGTAQYLSGSNIDGFRGCSSVEGNLIINQMSLSGDAIAVPSIPPITLDQLAYLATIKQINGYLHIHDLSNENITNLRFLQNLEIVNGNETVTLRSGDYAVIVEDNDYIQTLGFTSLQRIENGGIRISSNPELCLVDTLTLNDFLVTSTLMRSGGLGTDCSNYMCHSECSLGRGCWGTLPDECVECRNYNYIGTCLSSCDLSVSSANDSTMQCVPLAPPPTTMDLTTNAATTMATTSTHPHTTHTTQPNPPSTDKPSTPTTSVPTDEEEELYWPTVVVPFVMATLLLILLVGLVAICYCCYCSKNSSKSNTLHDDNNVGDVESDIISGSYKTKSRISLRDLSSRRFLNFHSNSTDTYNIVPVEDSVTKPLKHSLTLSDMRTHGTRSSSEESHSKLQTSYHNSTFPRAMHPGVYSTREPLSSHPHRSSQVTHRGSTSSFRGGRGSRLSSMPSQSSNTANYKDQVVLTPK